MKLLLLVTALALGVYVAGISKAVSQSSETSHALQIMQMGQIIGLDNNADAPQQFLSDSDFVNIVNMFVFYRGDLYRCFIGYNEWDSEYPLEAYCRSM
ncbi:MAG: hypothetical protein OXH47_10180 [Paracoccaceae bacterium]|nr:hypothetical protein [Paracoccaceae bacterium]